MPPPQSRAGSIGRSRDFATTLTDGRQVVGRFLDDTWFVYVYASNDRDGRLLGYGTASSCLLALLEAGLSEHAALTAFTQAESQ